MKRIGIISDTHGYWDERFAHYFGTCDEIWHAGDIGTDDVADRLAAIAPLRAVCGNADGGDLRRRFPKMARFRCEEADVLLTHIGGYPGHYDRSVRGILMVQPPQLFVCGHSHILKVMYDKALGLLHINPGAAGIQGWHRRRTLVRLVVDGGTFRDLEVIELADRRD